MRYSKSDLAHIGVVPFDPIGTLENLLESAYEAYNQARLIGANCYNIRSDKNIARDIRTWKQLVFNCLDNGDYSLSYVGQIIRFQTGQLIMEEAIIQAHDQKGEIVAIGPFVSMAEKLAKIIDLD